MAKRKVSKFAKLTNEVAREYRNKGMSAKEAHAIGVAVAGKTHNIQMAKKKKKNRFKIIFLRLWNITMI